MPEPIALKKQRFATIGRRFRGHFALGLPAPYNSGMNKKICTIVLTALLAGCASSTIVPLKEFPVAATEPAATEPASQPASTQPGLGMNAAEAIRQSTTQPTTLPHVEDPNQTTQSIYGGNYDVMWREARILLSQLGFRLDRQDYRQGVMTTLPLESPNVMEFWAPDREGFKSSLESTVNFYRRTIRVIIEPRNNYQSYRISVQALVERRTNPTEDLKGPVHAGAGAFTRQQSGLRSDFVQGTKEDLAPQWYVVGREPGFEEFILKKLLKKI